mmetsp:Transcript_63648/g.149166  ORF Transcript_63648/g.149166 Transcript_63648/m.149166 type:complete len:204 (+) Transcript_63648:385-996(+)
MPHSWHLHRRSTLRDSPRKGCLLSLLRCCTQSAQIQAAQILGPPSCWAVHEADRRLPSGRLCPWFPWQKSSELLCFRCPCFHLLHFAVRCGLRARWPMWRKCPALGQAKSSTSACGSQAGHFPLPRHQSRCLRHSRPRRHRSPRTSPPSHGEKHSSPPRRDTTCHRRNHLSYSHPGSLLDLLSLDLAAASCQPESASLLSPPL